jgi:diaminohydroxyphosphoribosylaminopyrimidine deaminase/5-amino-6-(5-phosphoribosylamino)uracil reductase
MNETDAHYLKLALRLAARGAGWVSPNPMVGAVVVKDGRIVGRGYHRRVGAPHAEVEALRQAGAAAKDGDLYVTLEPCNHQGRTPPCTQAVLAAGVRRVIIAVRDPNPRVTGDGAAFLASRGLEIETGLLESEARRLNEAFFKAVTTGLPFVIAKAACSLDGRIATATGESQWLTGPAARAFGHKLRHQADAILVGVGTVLADDPQLTARLGAGGKREFGRGGQGPQAHLQSSPDPPPPTPYPGGTGFQPVTAEGEPVRNVEQPPPAVLSAESRENHQSELTENRKPKTENRFKDPIRIVLDTHLRIPLTARLLHLDSPAPTWIACTERAPAEKIRAVEATGAEVLVLPEEYGRVALQPLLELLGERQVQSLLLEGGAEVLGAFFDQRLVDKFYFFYAPRFVGGRGAPAVLGGEGIARLEDALQAKEIKFQRLGTDLLISGYL